MEKFAKIVVVLLLAAAVCACSRIPDYSGPDNYGSSDSSESSDNSSNSGSEEFPLKEFNIVKKDQITKLNAEGGVHDGEFFDGGPDDSGTDGKGYIALKAGCTLTHIFTAETSQHYRVILAARSSEGAFVKFDIGGKTEGSYYIPPYKADEDTEGENSGGGNFSYCAVENVYFEVGANTLNFNVGEGSVDIDYILVESMDKVSDKCYNIGNACVSPSISRQTIALMDYLSAAYGKRVLTAQNVSVGTNAEIDAIFKETGRYPAIRVGEMALLMKDGEYNSEKTQKDIELALEWSGKGGIVAYTWHWYSPNSKRGMDPSDFSMEKVFEGLNISDVALFGEAEIKAMTEQNFIEPELVTMLEDLDMLAAELKRFDDKNIPIIFEPIPDGDTGLYWWGNDPDDYKKLWTLIFSRLCVHHDLKNLIWVWNGSNVDFYPGNTMVDIIGQSFYENSDSPFAGRFSAVANLNTARKIQAVTACDTLPDVDGMFRDNAVWLWTAIDSGEYIVNKNGRLIETYTKRTALNRVYNHEMCVTRDELNL